MLRRYAGGVTWRLVSPGGMSRRVTRGGGTDARSNLSRFADPAGCRRMAAARSLSSVGLLTPPPAGTGWVPVRWFLVAANLGAAAGTRGRRRISKGRRSRPGPSSGLPRVPARASRASHDSRPPAFGRRHPAPGRSVQPIDVPDVVPLHARGVHPTTADPCSRSTCRTPFRCTPAARCTGTAGATPSQGDGGDDGAGRRRIGEGSPTRAGSPRARRHATGGVAWRAPWPRSGGSAPGSARVRCRPARACVAARRAARTAAR